ncbi:MAG TPA: hypothetical protein VGE94_02940 [Chloroflexota bacterium]
MLRPEHIVPRVLQPAVQGGAGETGCAWDAVTWSQRHGYGGRQAWLAQSAIVERAAN